MARFHSDFPISVSIVRFAVLLQLVQFFVEVGQRGFQLLLVIGVGCGFQIVEDVFAREFDIRAFAVFFQLILSFLGRSWCRHILPAGYLGFNVFAFPTPRHA